MKTKIQLIQLIATVILLSLFLYRLFSSPSVVTLPGHNTIKTDTVTKYQIMKPLKPLKADITPSKIIEYRIIKQKDIDELAKLKLKIQNDSIYISSLEKTVSIHQNYLKLFPESPKLIDFEVNYNKIAFSFLDLNGNLVTSKYPVNLLHYKYRWVNSGLTANKIRNPIRNFNIYSGMGYEVLSNSPFAGFKIEQNFTRSRIFIDSDLILLDIDRSTIKIGIEYKLLKDG